MKLTKEQQYAIEGLLVMLDELEDKPRRLYRALEDLALAFNKTGAIPSIREAQDFMYEHLSQGNIYSCLFSSLREFTKEQWRRYLRRGKSDEEWGVEQKIEGAKEFVKLHIRELTDNKFN